MQMNIPATFGPICFSGSLEEDWNVYGQTTDAKWWQKVIWPLAMWAKKGNNSKMGNVISLKIAGYVDLDMLHIFVI